MSLITLHNAAEIAVVKRQVRRLLRQYDDATEHLDCGAQLALYMGANVSRIAREINEAMARLKDIDPDFPEMWTPLAEGK